MSIDYTTFPLADTPYVAHLVPWDQLAPCDKQEALARFNGTFLVAKKMEDFSYICAPQGGVIGRRLKDK
jgi:hypothetical protein